MSSGNSLILIISSLRSGGAERVLSDLANKLADGNKVTLVTFSPKEEDHYTLDKHVQVVRFVKNIKLPLIRLIFQELFLIIRLRRFFRKKEKSTILAFGDRTNIISIVANFFSKHKLVISERVNPEFHNSGKLHKPTVFLRKLLYRFTDVLVVQTNDVVSYFKDHNIKTISTIPNGVDLSRADLSLPLQKVEQKNNAICCVGRLDRQKGYDILFNSINLIKRKGKNVRCKIVGEGHSRKQIELMIDELKLDVKLVGRSKNPWLEVSECPIFVLSSRYEGFPNALLEAMSLGKACIAFDCPSGPSEIIQDGFNGFLVENGNQIQLAERIFQLIDDPKKINELGRNAFESVKEFDIKNIHKKWEEILILD